MAMLLRSTAIIICDGAYPLRPAAGKCCRSFCYAYFLSCTFLLLCLTHISRFACGAHGDCIDFAARLFRLTPLEAARKLAADFGAAQEKPKKHDEAQRLGKDERLCFLRLSEHCRALRRRKAEFAPRRPDDDFDARFAAACRELEYAEYLLDELTFGNAGARAEAARLARDLKLEV